MRLGLWLRREVVLAGVQFLELRGCLIYNELKRSQLCFGHEIEPVKSSLTLLAFLLNYCL